MSIKLTKTINGKEVVLDLISLDGKTVVRYDSYKELLKQGIRRRDLVKEGYKVERQGKPQSLE